MEDLVGCFTYVDCFSEDIECLVPISNTLIQYFQDGFAFLGIAITCESLRGQTELQPKVG